MKVENRYLEIVLNSPDVIQKIVNRDFPIKVSYWLARVFDKLQSETKPYLDFKRKLIDKYANHYEKDGEEKDEDGRVIKSWKKGDVITGLGGIIDFNDLELFKEEYEKLQSVEIDIEIEKIPLDLERGNSISIGEMMLLLPLVEVVEEAADVKKTEGEKVRNIRGKKK